MRISSTNLRAVLIDERVFGTQLGYIWHTKIKSIGSFKQHVNRYYEGDLLLIQQIKRKVL